MYTYNVCGHEQRENQPKLWTEPMWRILEGLAFAFCSGVGILRTGPPMSVSRGYKGKKWLQICTQQMCLKQLFAKQVPVTEWPSAKALPSTPLLLNVFGMWEKLVTRGLPIVQCLSCLKCEHSRATAVQPPNSELDREIYFH